MKKFFMLFFICFVLFICCGCQGDVTRSIRHDGFNVGSNFVCDIFFPKKDNVNYEKIKYITGNLIISEKGRIYDISLGQMYANNSNCKVADTTLEVSAIFDNHIFRATDGKMYYLVSNNDTNAYTEVTSSDNSYELYYLFLNDLDVIKVMTVDSSNGIYYALLSDGNVYSYKVVRNDRNSPLVIADKRIVYNRNDYGNAIVDFNYAGNSSSTFVRTEDKAFKMMASNFSECSKYADINCNYEMSEFVSYSKYRDYIIAYNGSLIITSYGKTFSVVQ